MVRLDSTFDWSERREAIERIRFCAEASGTTNFKFDERRGRITADLTENAAEFVDIVPCVSAYWREDRPAACDTNLNTPG